MTDFKALPLAQDLIDTYVNEFVEKHGYRIDERKEYESGAKVKVQRYIIGKLMTSSATIDFYCNGDGTTTIQYLLGKNQDLGLLLAEHIKNKIDPNEFKSVEMTLRDVKEQDFDPLRRAIENDCYDCGDRMFEIEIEHDNANLFQLRVQSVRHKDCLVIKHHKNANSLQLQGRPLFVYKRLCYHFIDILDILGIERVLSRRDETRAQIVSSDVAEHMLKCQFPKTFERSPEELRKLILSGMCVTLASPQLDDYSMLLYPDLRALEGALLDCFKAYGLYPSNYTGDGECRVGVMYRKLQDSTYTLKQEHVTTIACPNLVQALNKGYNHYSGKRHPLFHVNEELLFSTFIRDLGIAVALMNDTRNCIEELYTYRP